MRLNSVIVEGNLTRDPELTYLNSGTAKCSMSIAYNYYYNSNGERKEEVSFFDVVAWKYVAERCAQFVKGQRVFVIGTLRQDRWEREGQTRQRVYVVADYVLSQNRQEGE